jgi:hypothetical protein
MIGVEYAAGFFDGEGCIRVTCTKRGARRGRISHLEYSLMCAITNSNREILQQFADHWGGKVRPTIRTVNKQMWSWAVGKRDSILLLRDLRPYLMDKAPQADLAFRFIAEIPCWNSFKGHAVPVEIMALREGFYLAMKEAKGRSAA